MRAGYDSGIDSEGISELNLSELYATDNAKISDVWHMTNLKILDAKGTCGITDRDVLKTDKLMIYHDGNCNLCKKIGWNLCDFPVVQSKRKKPCVQK